MIDDDLFVFGSANIALKHISVVIVLPEKLKSGFRSFVSASPMTNDYHFFRMHELIEVLVFCVGFSPEEVGIGHEEEGCNVVTSEESLHS